MLVEAEEEIAPPAKRSRHSRLNDSNQKDIENFIMSILIDGSAIEVAFEILQTLRQSDSPLDELCSPPPGVLAKYEAYAGREESTATSEIQVQGLKCNPVLYERLVALSESRSDVRCAHCGQKVSAQRFAPHLDKCMGKSRNRRSVSSSGRKAF